MKFSEFRLAAGKNALSFVGRTDEMVDDADGVRFPLYIEGNERGQSKGEVLQTAQRKNATNLFMRTGVIVTIPHDSGAERIEFDGGEIVF